MHRSIHRYGFLIAIATVVALGSPPPAAIGAPQRAHVTGPQAAPGPLPAATTATPAPVPNAVPLQPLDAYTTSSNFPAGTYVCYFDLAGDYVHKSSGDASGHGWWINIDCPTSTATVTVQLQEWYSDGTWHNKGTKASGVVASGGGSGNRVTARVVCGNNNVAGWRSVIHADTTGIPTAPNSYKTQGQNIQCTKG